jgi:hypothetical protein
VFLKYFNLYSLNIFLHRCILTGEKITNKCTVIVYLFLKFIYLFIAPTCFGYSLAIIRVLVMWYSGRTMENIHIVLPLCHIKSTLMIARE